MTRKNEQEGAAATPEKGKKGKENILLTSEELSVFCDQIALMLESGMTLKDGIDMLAEDEEKQGARVRPYSLMLETIEETGSLYIAMKERETEWPHYMIEMVGIGEETGRLARHSDISRGACGDRSCQAHIPARP